MPWLCRRLIAKFSGAHLRGQAVQNHPRTHQRRLLGPVVGRRALDDLDTGQALAIIVLCGLVGASMSTANGAILAISNVSVRNLGGVRRVHVPGQRDPLLRATRIAMVPVTLLAILIAIYVKQTGILLTLAFDLLLACLVVPFILGLVWRKGSATAALVSIVVGLSVRLVLFVMTPTMYGLDNTILYVPNGVFEASFDGWPTFIAFAASLVTYVVIALLTPPALIRGLDIHLAQDLDDALAEVDVAEPESELVKAEAGQQ